MEVLMLQDHATASTTSASTIPPNVLTYRDGANVDLSIASGARRGFEGLIATRGRADAEHSTRRPAAPRRALVSVPKESVPTLQVGVAASREQLEAADRLIRKRYAWRGYSLEAFEYQNLSMGVQSARREITFFAADQHATLGTITLRLDGPDGLRAESTHGEVVQRARGEGRCIGELTRLALAEDVDSRQVLASLFGLVYTVGRVQHGVTDVFIEVNPRHVVFYSRAIGFAVVGGARFCERVCAPSVLLHLDVETLEEQLGLENPRSVEAPLMRYGT
jgi:hypothetical protein